MVIGLAACAGPTPATAAAAPAPTPCTRPRHAATTARRQQGIRQQVEVTFYAAADNDPPGSAEIAYPNSRHTSAGGTGTYADPLSLATDPREIRPGVLVYYPPVEKYFVMEDDCAECIDDWSATGTRTSTSGCPTRADPAVQNCEAALTPDDPDTIIVNPPADLPVDPKPLLRGREVLAGHVRLARSRPGYAGVFRSNDEEERPWVATRSWSTRSRGGGGRGPRRAEARGPGGGRRGDGDEPQVPSTA